MRQIKLDSVLCCAGELNMGWGIRAVRISILNRSQKKQKAIESMSGGTISLPPISQQTILPPVAACIRSIQRFTARAFNIKMGLCVGGGGHGFNHQNSLWGWVLQAQLTP